MNANLLNVIDACAGRRVLVIGEAMLDSYLEGAAGRLCREAPVPVVNVTCRTDVPGGAANTAANVAALGAHVVFLSAIGADAEGELLRRALEARAVPVTQVLTSPARHTPVKHRVVAAGQILVRFDQGSTDPVDAPTEQALIARLGYWFPRCDAVIVSDYGYGILTPRIIAALADLQARLPRVLVVDARDLAAYRQVGSTAVKPNYEETVQLLGLKAGRDSRVAEVTAQGARVLDLAGTRIAAITLDTDGGLIFERGQAPYRIYARPGPHSRATGAGDTFVSTLALALAAGAPTPIAAELAAAATAVVVARDGTVCCSAAELRESLSAGGRYVSSLARLTALVETYRAQGRRIVFTNGCFDILHRGHSSFLSQAKALGDVLIVGINSDAGVRRLKGPGRPINPLEDRVQVLAALSGVDHVIAFDEAMPDALIRAVRPDIFAKGGNYTREDLPEAALVEALGGVVRILPYLQDHSTAHIIRRTRAVHALPAFTENGLADGNAVRDVSRAPYSLPLGDGVYDAPETGAA